MTVHRCSVDGPHHHYGGSHGGGGDCFLKRTKQIEEHPFGKITGLNSKFKKLNFKFGTYCKYFVGLVSTVMCTTSWRNKKAK